MNSFVIGSVAVALGIMFLGAFIYNGIAYFKDSERVVSVKGLSEREVKADKVIWPLVYKQAGNDISALYKNIEQTNNKIIKFLLDNGIAKNEITVAPVSVLDADAERYSDNNAKFRYKAVSVITVVTGNVDTVLKLMSKQNDLIKQGIALSVGDYQYQTIYSYNGLNDIKPEMIVEATKNARLAAEKFAKDSASKLGKIKTANQGQLTISDRDNNTPYIKSIRVVTTIQYYLKD
ncbi:SIMPL domain-containing protein [Endomicrobium proavitum]|uniref:SIMPL domain-containing protein n=1 Tax=Endomicrobium proavitum TaxID=1408281 RepID=UPI0006970D83